MLNGYSRQSQESLGGLSAAGEYSMQPLDAVDHVKPESGNESGLTDDGGQDEEEGASLISNHHLHRHPRGSRSSWPHVRQSSFPSSMFKAISRWTQGPVPPRIYRIQSSEWLQVVCDRLLDKLLPSRWLKLSLLLLLYILWIGMFISALPVAVLSDTASETTTPARMSCTSQLWSNSTNCGLNGQECGPFENSNFTFVCPAGCANVKILEPHYVGAQRLNYRSFVIGGPRQLEDPTTAIYRADSFICAAAIHAGVISNQQGGESLLVREGQQSDYPSIKAHGITSIGFESNFPLSFTFGSSNSNIPSYRDSRWTYLGFSILFTSLVAIFATSSTAFFWTIFIGVFTHVALISDPPYYDDYTDLLSLAVRRFLPAAFVGHVIHRYCLYSTLHDLKAPIERTVLWLGGLWVGALNNVTFDRLPISRLTPHDLKQQPGAVVALLSIVIIILIIAIGQAWCFRVEGRMPKYLLFYGIVGASIVILLLIPGMNLRIHHYILALIFLPGTSLQTRPSLHYQGILVGLFINGIARWGFDSILQTPGQLLQDGELGSLLPEVDAPLISDSNITFTFANIAESFDGVSVLVNDVQRFLSLKPDDMAFTWTRLVPDEPEFFRFGYVKRLQLGGEWYADFTAPAQWFSNGSWVPGVS
ncbi:hypothetical protein H2200_001933 [Cladophialophora chaetospira]|uniref:LCCL domain-containing protein n=1 Tax=Cladophialophora chaetospira TaxID=386627 RepID=A0AA38XLY3_9EURO|nr:hypothetical protein H2200_001933 [Cladophialophora chaetospira]